MTDSRLERAYALLKQVASDLEIHDRLAPEELAARLCSMSARIVDILDGNESRAADEVFTRLREQAEDIADDLRRAEELMRRHQRDQD